MPPVSRFLGGAGVRRAPLPTARVRTAVGGCQTFALILLGSRRLDQRSQKQLIVNPCPLSDTYELDAAYLP